ncbi:hypothetical protein K432DRAFT_382278 [Lepidopterella palustris CBS 459.81]|uniref:Uncharacterized protein n=1 Tax=Lepidopterella palustris CBS 459.81 TaxID=1314670 RepID=A0A8E2EAL0_9PEZI|nr:hypothetical protein K432DRAFT_382278 [Lepidopterella palustris CBS 459.81]
MASSTHDLELHSLPPFPAEAGNGDTLSTVERSLHSLRDIEQPPLPPADGGKAAWLVLAGCSLIQAPVWGTRR